MCGLISSVLAAQAAPDHGRDGWTGAADQERHRLMIFSFVMCLTRYLKG